ncbi:hypothetical protein BVRB_8g190560 [Beta vulgaris subsp. vulgaris]|nr:hypothetical protein BVRB_8g190560 [Beta vulgaris subsp. vulgaris]
MEKLQCEASHLSEGNGGVKKMDAPNGRREQDARKKRKRKQLVTREPLQKGGMSSKNANTLGKNKVEITLNPRHTVQQFMQLIKGLEGQDDKLRAIRDMGFGGLMHLNFSRIDTIFVAKLLRDFDPYGMCILLDRNRDIKVDAIDVHLVYGISIGGEVIVEGKNEDEKFYELLEIGNSIMVVEFLV